MRDTLTEDQIARVVTAAVAAPSIHNTQPWHFAVSGNSLLLLASPGRALPVADPDARALYLSCGAALYNARVALRFLGRNPCVRILPHPEYPFDVLAILTAENGTAPSRDETAEFDAIWRRHTDRRPYSGKPVPAATLAKLERAARRESATVRMLGPDECIAALQRASTATREMAADTRHQHELRHWVTTGRRDGIPLNALPEPPRHLPSPVRDADLLGAAYAAPAQVVSYEEHPQLVQLSTPADEPADWLRAGQALQRCLLAATAEGLSASFLYQAIERNDMRESSDRSVSASEHCQMIIRLGYGSHPARTPRRPLSDVMSTRFAPGRNAPDYSRGRRGDADR